MPIIRDTVLIETKPTVKKTFQIIFSRFLYEAVICFLIISFVMPTLIYFIIYDMGTEPAKESSTCVLQYGYRVPCGFVNGLPIGNVSQFRCHNINCCYDSFTQQCYHFFPSKFGYHQENQDAKIYQSFTYNTPLGNPTHENLTIQVTTNNNFMAIDLVHENINLRERKQIDLGLEYKISSSNRLTLEVNRKSNPKKVILQTGRGPLIASNGYWEWTMQLGPANSSLYGLGGLDINGNLTRVIYNNAFDHKSLPCFLTNYEEEFHAVCIEHVGPLEVQVTESKLIIMRSLNSEGLGLKLYPGPTIQDIRNQRLGVLTPSIPKWMLGSHICRNKVADLQTLLQEYLEESDKSILEAESDCINELLMIFFIETYTKMDGEKLKMLQNTFSSEILKKNKKFILAFSPHIPIGNDQTKYDLYKEAEQMDVLLKNNLNRVYEGKYKGRNVAILNYNSINIKLYLKTLLEAFEKAVNINIAAVYLLDNWPQDDNFNFNPIEEQFLYYNEDLIKAMNQTPTLIQNQESYITKQIQTIGAILGEHVPIFSASTFHNLYNPQVPQHVEATWTNLKNIVDHNLFTSIFTHPISHTPVCGTAETISNAAHDNELCARWYLNAALQPGHRFTSDWLLQTNFTASSKNIAEKALNIKHLFSFYQYYNLRQTGFAIKPTFVDFVHDNRTWELENQFMIGDLITVQILLPQSRMTRVYLPGNDSWFEFWGGLHFGTGWKEIGIVKDDFPMFQREGSLVHLLKKSTDSIPNDYFDLIIASKCNITEEDIIQSGIFFNNVELKLTANIVEGYLQVDNILEVQYDINCKGIPNSPTIINQVKVFNCVKPTMYHSLNFNLCSSVQDQEKLMFVERDIDLR